MSGMGESAVCGTCGGHTGALNTPDTPSTPMTGTPVSAVSKTFRNTYMPTPRTPSSSFSPMSPIPKTARRKRREEDSRAGVEALLQLGIHEQEDGELSPTESTSQAAQGVKKRRLNAASPTSNADVMAGALQTPQSSVPMGFSHHQSIDPFLKHPALQGNSFGGSESPAAGGGELESGSPSSSSGEALKGITALQKLQAISRICKPLPAPETGAPPRGAIIAIDGEDPIAVKDLCESLADTLRGERVEIISIGDEFEVAPLAQGGICVTISSNNGADLDMQTLGAAGLKEDGDEDNLRTAIYLQALADWRMLSNKMRKKVLNPATGFQPSDSGGGSDSAMAQHASPVQLGRFPILLLNRYILSRTDCAVSKLPSDGLAPVQHWQWAASVWKGCVGADMTILVKTDGPLRGDGVEVKEPGKVLVARRDVGKEWDGGRVRRLGFEVNECVRTLMGNT